MYPGYSAAPAYIGPAGPPGMMASAGPTVAELAAQREAYQHNAAPVSHEGANKKILRMAGGEIWEDPTLAEWPEDDYRIFVGDLGNEVTEETLFKAFGHYTSVAKVKVIRDKITTKSKGFGFVSMTDPVEFLKALKEMNGVYIGNRPCKIKKSNWKQRDLEERKKQGKAYANTLVSVQSKGTGKAVHKRKARPLNAGRDDIRHKRTTGPPM